MSSENNFISFFLLDCRATRTYSAMLNRGVRLDTFHIPDHRRKSYSFTIKYDVSCWNLWKPLIRLRKFPLFLFSTLWDDLCAFWNTFIGFLIKSRLITHIYLKSFCVTRFVEDSFISIHEACWSVVFLSGFDIRVRESS